jgi:phosphoribosylaminoimidazole-succinocarboxamide synthase
LIENGFQGKDGQKIPEMTDQIVSNISSRYQELYQQMTGEKLAPIDYSSIEKRIEQSIVKSLN